MLLRALSCSLLLSFQFCIAAPDKETPKISAEGAPPADLPEPPFKIKAPADPPAQVEKIDLKTVDAEDLSGYAAQAMEAENTDDAYAFLFWSLRRAPRGGEMQALARLSITRNKTDDAYYWLQRAIVEDQFDPDDTGADPAFKPVRTDERYAKLKAFSLAAREVWKKSGYHREMVTTPKGYKPGTPVPVFIALHGLGSQPEDFGRSGEPQDLADELGAAIVSISATEPWGKNSFSWKEDFEADWTHIQKSLERVKDKVTPQPGRCIAAGFSQGGQLAAELAAAHPDFFAGAIVMSPGYRGKRRLEDALKAGGAKTAVQLYFITWITEEDKTTVAAAKEDEKILTAARARVISHGFPGDSHSFPPDQMDHFAIWAKLILAGKP
ncbi:MAG TPA: alpha/beta hydrolase-fold protein [Verrucomicrobiales bacterium]|nr:alpha/beta hydrolase-fold protein [Verrucomicrobiales bacterium]